MRIFLIGMPGSGKTTFGKKLASRFNHPFIDLDHEIVAKEQDSITTIFERKGESYFRQLETSVLKETTLGNDSFIMATGGGTPCFLDNLEFMKTHGNIIYIKTPVEILAARLKEERERPLLKVKETLRQSLNELATNRLPFYEQAHFTVKNYDELVKIAEKL